MNGILVQWLTRSVQWGLLVGYQISSKRAVAALRSSLRWQLLLVMFLVLPISVILNKILICTEHINNMIKTFDCWCHSLYILHVGRQQDGRQDCIWLIFGRVDCWLLYFDWNSKLKSDAGQTVDRQITDENQQLLSSLSRFSLADMACHHHKL